MDKRKIIKARNNKKDEFYTQLIDIENEILNHKDYIKHFDNKIVFCNCDDPEWSNFFNFFKEHFIEFKLKKLISTHYTNQNNNSYKLTIVKNEYSNELVEIKENLIGNGDFRSDECIEILKSSDIVVTNPPFSLLRDYVRTIMKYNKKFILIGNVNLVSSPDIFRWIQNGQIWAGYSFNKTMNFEVGENYDYDKILSNKINNGKKYCKVPSISWYTNLDIDKRHINLNLTASYLKNKNDYIKYQNYNAINVNNIKDIPKDYDSIMRVCLILQKIRQKK